MCHPTVFQPMRSAYLSLSVDSSAMAERIYFSGFDIRLSVSAGREGGAKRNLGA
jgi:hypothetical protein